MPRKRIIKLQQVEYQNILRSYKKYIAILGFSENGQDGKYAAIYELLEWLESQAIYPITKVEPQHIQRYYEHLCQRPNKYFGGVLHQTTINHHINALRGFFSFLQESNQLLIHPMASLHFKIKKAKTERRIALSEGQIRDLYRACQTRLERAVLSLAYGCGLRNGELVRLNVADINLEQNIVIVKRGKGNKRRVIPMSAGVQKDLYDYLNNERELYLLEESAEQEAVFYHSRGGRMQGYTFRKIFAQIIERSENPSLKKYPFTLYHLRHSIATHLLQSGVSVEQVSNFLGHAHLETTEVYTHINTEQLRQLIQ